MTRNMRLHRQYEHAQRQRNVSILQSGAPDIMVMPVDILRCSGAASTPDKQRQTIRVVLYSRGRKPVAMTRTFDLDKLRATIPEQIPSVRARRASVIALPKTGILLSPSEAINGRRHSSSGIRGPDPALCPAAERRPSRPELPLVPLHLEYARAYVPVVASIILSDVVRPGDTIELPLPHPRAWHDTVAYMYTGCVVLSEPIRQNLLYLGGKA